MNKNFLLCLISIALVTSCTNLPDTAAVATAPVATPTPKNYTLYTNSELQIYSETIDLKIQQALKNNNPNQAQEFGRKRQELIADAELVFVRVTVAGISKNWRGPLPIDPQTDF